MEDLRHRCGLPAAPKGSIDAGLPDADLVTRVLAALLAVGKTAQAQVTSVVQLARQGGVVLDRSDPRLQGLPAASSAPHQFLGVLPSSRQLVDRAARLGLLANPPPPPRRVPDDLSSLTAADLRALCTLRGLPRVGKRADLLQRLTATGIAGAPRAPSGPAALADEVTSTGKVTRVAVEGDI